MTVAYDGRSFHGMAVQPGGVRTVAGVLSDHIERVLQAPVSLVVAGRTDAGVHAWGQVVSFDAPAADLDLARLQRSVNRVLGPEVVIREIGAAAPGFDARRSALARRYRYTVLNRAVVDPFLAATSWHVTDPLDLGSLRLACDPLIGEHDFAAFCRAPREVPDASLVRVVHEARWVDLGDGVLLFDIEAGSFCQQLVRALVGTMVDIGRGNRKAGEMAGILRSGSRAVAGRVAPAHGLCLWEVVYPAGLAA